MTPEQLAQECARLMWAEDRTAHALGMALVSISPGRAQMEMAVVESMTNGHRICHGGYLFTLADTAFAYACNSYNQRTVAAAAEIHFLAPAQLGERLLAIAEVRHQAKRSGLYDVVVLDQNKRQVALFRGRSASIKGQFVEQGSQADQQDTSS